MTSVSHRAPTTPEELLARFRTTRDPDALGALFDATAPSLLRVALSIAPDAASAENALQETFLAVLEAPERWDETRPVMPWLLGILHRQVGKVRRDNARRPDPLRLPPPLSDDPSALASSHEEQARVRAAIDELPEPYRAVAVLRWRHGLDPADIADVRGEPPGTTRSLLSRALEKLRERLGAGAFALFGWPGTKGLAGIRRALMSEAAVATTAGTTAAVVGGAIVMKKIVAACVVVALLGGGTWWTVAKMRRSSAASKSHADVVAAAERKRRRATESATAPKGELPPVDLNKCDRDLDLFGRVIDEDGKPVAGASVETVRYPWRGVSSVHWNEPESGPGTRTAKDGTFAVRLERGEKFDLRVTAEPFGPIVRQDCQAGERVEITLRRGATLDVTTVDESGVPVPGVRVKARRGTGRFGPIAQSRDGVTDAAGHVALTGLLAGPIYLDYLHPTLGEPKWQVPILPAAGTLSLRVTMPAGHTVHGRITDADTGKPINGALVDTFNFKNPVTTDAEGRYALHGWTFGSSSSFLLEVKAAGHAGAYRVVPEDYEVNVALQPGDHVVGRIVRADGTPVEDALVGAYDLSVGSREGGRSTDGASAARTAADGRFEIDGLLRDIPHLLIAEAPGLARKVVEFDRHFWTGSTIDLGDVVMSPPRSIEGVAVDLDDKPLADAAVQLAAGDGASRAPGWFMHGRSRRTDDLGRFRFPNLEPGSYSASVEAAGSPRGPFTRIELPSDRDVRDARVTLAGPRSLTVLVVDDLDAPLAGMSVVTDLNADSKSDGLLYVATGADGRAKFRGIGAAPATTYVSVNQNDGSGGQRFGPFGIDGQEVRVVVHRRVEVRGVVRGEDGKPLRSSIKATLHGNATDAGSGWSDETGEFTAKVPLGAVVDLWAQGTKPDAHGSTYTGFEGRVNGVTGPKDGVEIVLHPMKVTYDRALTVVVQDSTGVPFPGVEIGVYEYNPNKTWKVKTDADGRARFEGLANHLIVLNFAEMQDLAPQHALDIAPQHFSLTPNGQEVVVKYRAGAAIRGRVVDAQGRGVAEPYIQVTTPDATYINVRGDADGRFTAYGLAGLPHQLMAQGYADGKPSGGTVEKVVPGDAEVTVTVAPQTTKR